MKRLCHQVNQRGAVAVLVALMLVVLIGAAGIVLDLGRLFVAKTELQNAADACALAAARELATPSTLAVLTLAENAGITVGNEQDGRDPLHGGPHGAAFSSLIQPSTPVPGGPFLNVLSWAAVNRNGWLLLPGSGARNSR